MATSSAEQAYLARIETALQIAGHVARKLSRTPLEDPDRQHAIRLAEREISDALRTVLQQTGEGWLCEEDADDPDRLGRDVVWVVDPVDGTREFIDGVPEWSISIGLVIEHQPVAGGIFNPTTDELFLGSIHLGVTHNGRKAQVSDRSTLDGAVVLASRQEFMRGKWARFQGQNFSIRPTGSIAYKLGMVAAGLADATWTLSPKNEWDVAAGVALVRAAGGHVYIPGNTHLHFNNEDPLLSGLVAASEAIWPEVNRALSDVWSVTAGIRSTTAAP